MTRSRAKIDRAGQQIGRRQFLQRTAASAAGAVALPWLQGCTSPPPVVRPRASRLVLVRFGGGVRYRDLFGGSNHFLAPHLRSLARSGTWYSNVWNSHLTRHDTATRYLLTGRYGSRFQSNDAGTQNLQELSTAPLLFELFRKARNLPASKTLAAGVPEHSQSTSFGAPFGALSFARESSGVPGGSISGDPGLGTCPHVWMANQRLGRIVSSIGNTPISLGLRESRFRAAAIAEFAQVQPDYPELTPALVDAITDRMLADRPFVTPEEADGWLTDLTLRAMRSHRPDLVTIAYSTPDLAHLGAWQSYADAVRRIDVQLSRLSRMLETDPYYRGRTVLLVTTDCGRGDVRFDHHLEPFEENSHRQVFLVAHGPSVPSGVVVDDRHEQVDVAATIGELMGFEIPDCEGMVLPEIT